MTKPTCNHAVYCPTCAAQATQIAALKREIDTYDDIVRDQKEKIAVLEIERDKIEDRLCVALDNALERVAALEAQVNPRPCQNCEGSECEKCDGSGFRCVGCATYTRAADVWQGMLQNLKAEVQRLKVEAKEDDEMYQGAFKEMDEMMEDFCRALGLPEKIPGSEHETPGYPHILEAINALHADLAPFVALARTTQKFYDWVIATVDAGYLAPVECVDEVRAALAHPTLKKVLEP